LRAFLPGSVRMKGSVAKLVKAAALGLANSPRANTRPAA
jgi:hypothetical protein